MPPRVRTEQARTQIQTWKGTRPTREWYAYQINHFQTSKITGGRTSNPSPAGSSRPQNKVPNMVSRFLQLTNETFLPRNPNKIDEELLRKATQAAIAALRKQ